MTDGTDVGCVPCPSRKPHSHHGYRSAGLWYECAGVARGGRHALKSTGQLRRARMVRRLTAGALPGVALIVGLIAGHLAPHGTPGPSPCAVWASPGHRSYLPSGDAGMVDGREQVCTDGTWVKVTGYGN